MTVGKKSDSLKKKRPAYSTYSRTPVDEVMALEALYRERYGSGNIKHFHEHYQDHHQGGVAIRGLNNGCKWQD